jgi:hypothetical protein
MARMNSQLQKMGTNNLEASREKSEAVAEQQDVL